MNKPNLRFALIVIAAAALAALCVARFDDVCALANTAWGAFEPLVVGAVLAYLLNFVVAWLESLWFPRSKNALAAKTRRPVCVVLAIALVTLALVALATYVGGEF